MRTIQLFNQGHLDDVLRNLIQQMTQHIDSEEERYLLNVNEEEYIQHIIDEFSIDPPVVDFDGKFAESAEKMIPASRHPSSIFFMDDPNKEFKRQVIVFHLPFTGDVNILDYMPNPAILWSKEVVHEIIDGQGVLSFEVINFSQNPEEVKRNADTEIGSLQTQLGHIKNQIDGYNAGLRAEVEQAFHTREKDLLSKTDFMAQLGVPIRKKENLPETFAVSVPKIPKRITPKPSVSTDNGQVDPTMATVVYNEILQIMHDVGKAIERMPSTYQGKTEETLRDHFLMNLEPRFEGSATGETFNKTGKTDILLRYQNTNVFIAECKYWSGEAHYLETIGQILGYLTWRDSKASIVLFVKNKDFSSVIETVKIATPKHSNFLSFEGEKENTWLTYKIHLNGDPNRSLYLTILLFHFPDPD